MEGPSKYWDIVMINLYIYIPGNFYAIYLYVLTIFHLFCEGDNYKEDSLLEIAELFLNDAEIETMTFEE